MFVFCQTLSSSVLVLVLGSWPFVDLPCKNERLESEAVIF